MEYGCLRDRKFFDRTKDALLLSACSGKKMTCSEYLEGAKEKHENKIYYATDKVSQAQYISMLAKKDIEAVLVSGPVEIQFVSLLEDQLKVSFLRVDAELADALTADGEEFSSESLAELFKKVSGVEALTVTFKNLDDISVPALLNIPEQMRRYEDMMRYYTPDAEKTPSFAMTGATLVLNGASPVIRRLAELEEGEKRERGACQIWSLALLAQRQLSADELCSFLEISYKTLEESL